MEYSLTNTLYAKTRAAATPAAAATAPPGHDPSRPRATDPGHRCRLRGDESISPPGWPSSRRAGAEGGTKGQVRLGTTQELLWLKLSQNYTFDDSSDDRRGTGLFRHRVGGAHPAAHGAGSPMAGQLRRLRPGLRVPEALAGLESHGPLSLQGEWRSTRDSTQDSLDLGGKFPLWGIEFQARSRYNLAEKTFVENRLGLKYASQCWDMTLGYVDWTDNSSTRCPSPSRASARSSGSEPTLPVNDPGGIDTSGLTGQRGKNVSGPLRLACWPCWPSCRSRGPCGIPSRLRRRHVRHRNPAVRAGLTAAGVAWAFTSTHAANWQPLAWISHMADVELYRLDPAGHHGTNLALHGLNASLLFLLLLRPTGARGRSFTAAALFAIHPLRAESVMWVAQRNNLLGATFGLLSLLA